MSTEGMPLFGAAAGQRKYLIAEERARFLAAAEAAARCASCSRLQRLPVKRGARPHCWARRSCGRYARLREPQKAPHWSLPGRAGAAPAVIDALDLAHDLRARKPRPKARAAPLWPRSRMTAWRRVAAVMHRKRCVASCKVITPITASPAIRVHWGRFLYEVRRLWRK